MFFTVSVAVSVNRIYLLRMYLFVFSMPTRDDCSLSRWFDVQHENTSAFYGNGLILLCLLLPC